MGIDVLGSINSQQQLMTANQTATTACLNSADAAVKAIGELGDHNNDILAHPELRTLIAENAGVNNDFVDSRIDQHNTSPTAHPELLAKVTAIANDTSVVRQLIDDLISAHNQNTASHADIRGALNEIKLQIGSYNLPQIAKGLNDLTIFVHNVIVPEISDLQSRIAKYDASIKTSSNEIVTIKAAVASSSNDLLTVNKDGVKTADKVVTTTLASSAVDTASVLGYDQYADLGPRLINFTTTLPNLVGKNTAIKFTISGAEGVTPTNPIKYSLEYGAGDVVVDPRDNISAGDIIDMVVGDNNQAGDVIYLVCKVTDTVNGSSLNRIINTMVAEEFDVSRVSCYGLPAKVEPGKKYSFVVRNLADIDDGRFSYHIDAGASGLLFDKMDGIKAEETLTMTVPPALARDLDYVFNIEVDDKYGPTKTKAIVVHTNAIPGAANFRHNVPSFVAPSKSYEVRFSGIVSENGTPAVYGITCPVGHLSFSKTSGIVANENVTMSVDGTIVRGEAYEFQVTATDVDDATVNIDMAVIANTLPSATTVATTLPNSSLGGQTLGFTITGGGDLETSDVTYSIDAASSGFSFSKTYGIAKGETVMVTLPKVAGTIAKTFNIFVVDALNESSVAPKVITLTVEPIYVADQPFITSPAAGASVNADFEMRLSAFSMHVDI